MRQPIFLLILGGVADRACPSLGGRTPLMYARTPNLDEFAHHGQCGVMETLGPGVAPSSDLALFTLLGYDVHTHYPGRGLLEALGEGLDPLPEEVVLRARLCLVRERRMRLITVERAPDLPEEEARRMAEAIAGREAGGMCFRYRYTGRGDGFLLLRGGPEGPAVPHLRDSDPFAEGVDLRRPAPAPGAPDPPAARRTAHALAERLLAACRELNALDLPAVRGAHARGLRWALLSKWAGQWREIPPFPGWTGLRGATVASSPLHRGLARSLGLDFIEAPRRADPEAEAEAAVGAGREALASGFEFVLVHTQAAEDASRRGRGGPMPKVEAIEAIDRGVGSRLLRMAGAGEAVVCITSDHAAPSEAGSPPGGEAAMIHGAEPVPFAAGGRSVVADIVRNYDEVSCAGGMLGRFPGREALPRLLGFADRGRRAGLLPHRAGEPLEPPPSEPLWDVSLWDEREGASHGPGG